MYVFYQNSIILFILLIFLSSCNLGDKPSWQEKSAEADVEQMTSDTLLLLRDIVTIKASLKENFKSESDGKLYRKAEILQLNSGNYLYYTLDKDTWYSGIPSDEGDITYTVKFRLSDIDTTAFEIEIEDGESEMFYVRINMKKGRNIIVSKKRTLNERSVIIWKEQSKYIKIDFPKNSNRIRSEFKSYKMFNTRANTIIDYVENKTSTINDTALANKLIKVLKDAQHVK